jgi:hypothetical protein
VHLLCLATSRQPGSIHSTPSTLQQRHCRRQARHRWCPRD